MATEGQGIATEGAETQPRSIRLAGSGIRTAQDFANVMSALMSDVLSGAVNQSRANAACNAGRQMLKAVELQLKYGVKINETTGERTLRLVSGE